MRPDAAGAVRVFVFTVAVALLAACADIPLPMASPAEDVSGKRFEPPPPGMAALYVYRTRAGNDATLTVGQRTLGVLQGRTWLRADLPPGRYDLRCSLPAWPTMSSLDIDLREGEIATVSATETLTSIWSASCHLATEPPGVARTAILAGTRIKEVR